jgi:hypothetical protein
MSITQPIPLPDAPPSKVTLPYPNAHALPNLAPTNVCVFDDPDPNAGGACHRYGIQYGGPAEVVVIQFQHGPRGADTSMPGIFDDDLLAILEHRLDSFQHGPFACTENAGAMYHLQEARKLLGRRVGRRMAQGVLGANKPHYIAEPNYTAEKIAEPNYITENSAVRQ